MVWLGISDTTVLKPTKQASHTQKMGNKNTDGNAAKVLKNNKSSRATGPDNKVLRQKSDSAVLAFFQALCCGCIIAAGS